MEGGGRSSFQPPSIGDRAAQQVHYRSAVHRECQFDDSLVYDMLVKWFLGMNMTDPSFNHVIDHGVQPAGSE